eukprot:Skav227363  [mRNA]  locus=scaffold2373:19703:27562:+ [translate_table: standard]
MLYLTQVLNEIKKESSPPKSLRAEHLFKLNEAVFNLSEEDAVDGPLAAVEKIQIAYNTGKFDNTDSNFFYDYLALLGTMQNQHFFSQKQTEKMLGWIKEVVDGSGMLAPASGGSSSKALEATGQRPEEAATGFAARADESEPKGKTKSKAKEELSVVDAVAAQQVVAPRVSWPLQEPPAKASPGKKGKGKGQTAGKWDYEEEEEE